MAERPGNPQSSTRDLLSKVSRYEALFELAAVVNASDEIASVGEKMAHRLKYIVDVFSWRYICFDGDPEAANGDEAVAIVVDGYRGKADVINTVPASLSKFEMDLWRDRKTRILSGDAMKEALAHLPAHLQKDDLEQISINTLVVDGKTEALYFFARRRSAYTDLDLKCLAMVCGFFHTKVHTLWEQQKMQQLQRAYLDQELMLRQSERLATLGRLSAGMAHELNNPTSVARQAAEQLRTTIIDLERAKIALGEAQLSDEQRTVIATLEKDAEKRAKQPSELDPIERSDLEQEVEAWLESKGVEDPWEHAPVLVSMGLCAAELEELTGCFDDRLTPIVVNYFDSKFTAHTLLEEIGHGTERIAEIVKALKGYSYMDQAPVQDIDVREGLDDTLVMLSGKLKRGIKVGRDFAEDLPRIEGYGSELNQVWTNIIDNAVAAMHGEGSLDLRAYREDDWVVVEITDSGPGIPREVQDKIFDPFFTTKAPGEGTGLGLNISHGIIVEKHHGHISVDSKPGETRFTVKLPIDKPAHISDEEAGTATSPA
ncbi:MAG: ATP-binding protein [Woeseiaceae bacterium]|nr:ATP-binding protein [Woeseiaceae bacterium]